MKNIIYILALCLSFNASAQNITLSSATNAFIINDTYYPLNYVTLRTTSEDTTMVGILTPSGSLIATLRSVFYFKRANGNTFVNRRAIINFYDSFALSATGGGVYMAVGAPVAGGTPSYYLTVDGSGNLGQTSGGTSTTYITAGDNITIDSAGNGSVKTYTVTGSGGGSSCPTSCAWTNAVTWDADGYMMSINNLSYYDVSLGDGSTRSNLEAGFYLMVIGGNQVIKIDSESQKTFIGHGSTMQIYDNIAGKISFNSPNGIGTSDAMTAGTITISTTGVSTGSVIILTGINNTTPCATCGALSVGTIVDGTSFEIHSSLSTDTRQVHWWIIN